VFFTAADLATEVLFLIFCTDIYSSFFDMEVEIVDEKE
jgi:hypothetical protein